jgi:hypothetical protein
MGLEIKWFLLPPQGPLAETAEELIRSEMQDTSAQVVLVERGEAWDVRLIGGRDEALRHHLVKRLQSVGFPAVALPGTNSSNVKLSWSSEPPEQAELVEEIALSALTRPFDWPTGREWQDRIAGEIVVTLDQGERLNVRVL